MADYVRVDDLEIQQGDDRAFTWPLVDSDGDPMDLGDYSAVAQVRARPQSSVVLHEWSTANGRAQLGNGKLTLLVDDSEGWSWSHGVYDIHLTDGSGKTEVIARGSVVLIPGVTRAGA